MKKKSKLSILIVIAFIISIISTGCSTDEMDGIEIITTNYANEYIVNRIYKDHAKITSIYPDGVDTSTYTISAKKKQEYSKKDIFIYNGLIEVERNLAMDLLDINPSLKIIDTAYVLETDYAPEELWLNPSSLLMMSQNVKNGLIEYVSSTYLHKDITDAYNALKVDLSELDVMYREAVNDAPDKNIIIDDSTLKYLEKFGLKIYCIDSDATDKTKADVENLIATKKVSYIITFKNVDKSSNLKEIIKKYPTIKTIDLHKLNILSDEERKNSEDYLTITRNNLTLLNQELYQ